MVNVGRVLRLQLKQHSFTKHRGKSPRWIDTTTGKIYSDAESNHSPSPRSSSPSSSSSVSTLTTATQPASTAATSGPPTMSGAQRKPTARKSTSRSAIRVAMFRCGEFFSIRECSTASRAALNNGGSPANSRSSGELSVDSGVSQSDPPLLCCHLCRFRSQSIASFSSHLLDVHSPSASQRIVILPNDDPNTARRCGFCPFKAYFDGEFCDHISTVHHKPPPSVCMLCRQFASFHVDDMLRHLDDVHASTSGTEYELLSSAYSMCGPQYVSRDTRCSFNASVSLTDMAELSEVQLNNLLDLHEVWFDY